MPNVYTRFSNLGTNLVQTAYDRLVEFALRPMPWYRLVADKRPVNQTQPGTTVQFQLYNDLAPATTPLDEVTDPDSVGVPATSTVNVTLNEYGNAALVTRKLRMFSLSDVDPAIADIIAYNMVDSIDAVVRDVLRQGTNVIREAGAAMTFNTGSAVNVTATDTLKSRDIRAAVAKLRAASVVPREGSSFVGYMHPDASYDLRSETSGADWRSPHVYSGVENIWGGTVGEYEGVLWVETPRAYSATDGASSAKVHRTIICGKQALAEAVGQEFGTVIGPVVDKLMRFRPIGWYGVAGWSIYRQAAVWRIEHSSTL